MVSPRRWLQRQPAYRRIAAAVGLFYYLSSVFILRDVLTGIPGVLDGSTVINGDELVPYFNPTSQLIDQAKGEFSELTNGYEFRVRYSFLTTWLRHYKVLPFAMILGLPTIVFAAYLTVVWFVRKVFRSLSAETIALAAAFPTALIYSIAIYAKVTHFYTLVVGLCMMMISALVMLYALIFARHGEKRLMAISCLVALFNPAVHYLILFTLFLSLTVLTLVVGEFSKWLREGGSVKRVLGFPMRAVRVSLQPRRIRRSITWVRRWVQVTTTGRCALAFTMLLWITLVPYALFVKFIALRGVENLSETVPGDYYFIRDASVSLVHVFSWDLAGIMDKILFGDYLAKVPRVSNMVYSLLAFAPLLVPGLRRSLFRYRAHRQLLGVIYVNVVFAIWATVGYANPSWFPTFHRSLAATTRALYATETPIGDLTLGISSTVVQVLRFPHRFQLILFMLGPLLMTLPLAWVIERLNNRHGVRDTGAGSQRASLVTRIALTIAVGSVFFVPLLSNSNYREVYTSGNFAHFATPYPVDDLQELKVAMSTLPEGKTVVLPPTETSKLVVDPNGIPHKFIDKFYIYYLDQPSFYFGLTGDATNKFEFFLILRSLYYQQDWWINVARDIGLDYIVLNKQIQNNRGVGAEYLPDLELYLREQIEAQPDYVQPLFENDSFVLYKVDTTVRADRDVLLFDTSWSDYLDAVFARLELSRCYDFAYISDFEPPTDPDIDVHVLATDRHDAGLDLWASENPSQFFVPSSKIFAFNPDVVASSYYLSPMFRLFLFFSDTKWNRTEMITPGIFGTIRGSFIGVPRPTRFTVPVTVQEPGRYRVLMRAAATANQLDLKITSLDWQASHELRSGPDALQLFDQAEIYDPERVQTDTSGYSVAELEGLIPSDLVPVNLRYQYFDLGTIDATEGLHSVVIDKDDANPMLVEGLLLVPEDADTRLEASDTTIVNDVIELECSEMTDVRYGARDPYRALPATENGPHADLTDEELWELIGLDDLAPPDSDGLGGRWVHIFVTLAVVAGCFRIVRWRATARPDEVEPFEPERQS